MGQKYQSNLGKTCSQCPAPAHCKGLCVTCYYAANNKNSHPKPGRKCKHEGCETKPSKDEEFCSAHRQKARKFCGNEGCPYPLWKDGICRRCHKKKEHVAIAIQPEAKRLKNRARKAGVSVDLIESLSKAQNNKCAICSVIMERNVNASWSECIDHCHETLKGRGLLCRTCNHSLGLYENFQRKLGLIIEPYERYLDNPPCSLL